MKSKKVSPKLVKREALVHNSIKNAILLSHSYQYYLSKIGQYNKYYTGASDQPY